MNDRETRRYDIFGTVQIFGKDNTSDIVAGSKAAEETGRWQRVAEAESVDSSNRIA